MNLYHFSSFFRNYCLHQQNSCLVFWFLLLLRSLYLVVWCPCFLWQVHPCSVEVVGHVTDFSSTLPQYFYRELFLFSLAGWTRSFLLLSTPVLSLFFLTFHIVVFTIPDVCCRWIFPYFSDTKSLQSEAMQEKPTVNIWLSFRVWTLSVRGPTWTTTNTASRSFLGDLTQKVLCSLLFNVPRCQSENHCLSVFNANTNELALLRQ